MEPIEKLEPDFAVAPVRLLNWFNLLELNLGLCLSHLLGAPDPKDTYRAIARMSLERKAYAANRNAPAT